MTLKHCPVCQSAQRRFVKSVSPKATLYRCTSCGVGYWNDLWDSHKITEHYKNYYFEENSKFDPLNEKRFHAVIDQIEGVKPKGQLMEVGCGSGHFLYVAEKRGWSVTGLEVSNSAVEKLTQVRNHRGAQFSVIQQDFMKCNLPSESFDAICFFEVIEHFDDPIAFLKKAKRLLRHSGVLYLTTPNFNSLSRSMLRHRWRALGYEHRTLFTSKSMKLLVGLLDLRIEKMITNNLDIGDFLTKCFKSESLQKVIKVDDALIHKTSPYQLRHVIEKNRMLYTVKKIINICLRFWHVGDTLEVFLVKK